MSSRLVLAVFVLLPWVAEALPVLRLALGGDAQTLGMGAVLPFEDARAAAWRLERPALLSDETRPRLRFSGEKEATVDLEGRQPWAGTRASDFRSRATFVLPRTWRDIPWAIAGSMRFEQGFLRLRNTKDGVLFDVAEQRTAFQLALAARPFSWLRVGGTASTGLGRAYGVESAFIIGPVELGFVRRAESLAYDVSSPPGPKQKFQRPALVYDVSQLRQAGAATVAVRTKPFTLDVTADVLHPGDYLIQGTFRVWRLAFRGRTESTRFDFDDWAQNGGEDVARIDLGIVQTRWAASAELRLGNHEITYGHMETALGTASAWADNGAVTGRRLLKLDADFGLYLKHWYRASFAQDGLGWRWTGEAFTISAGLQHARIVSEAGGIEYGSAVVESIHGSDLVPRTVLKTIGATTGVAYRLGPVTLRFAVAQLVPYATENAATKVRADGSSGTTTTRSTTTRALQDNSSDGGRMAMVEIEQEL